MTDNELLLAMSEMMDTKLKSELQPIKNDLQSVKNELQSVKNEVQSEIQSVKSELQSEIQSVKSELQSEIQSVNGDLQSVKNDLQSVKDEVHQIKLYQENVILPRLNTIESCYTDTYNRYRNYADRMEAAFDDIELLKKVVAEHSEKLQKIS